MLPYGRMFTGALRPGQSLPIGIDGRGEGSSSGASRPWARPRSRPWRRMGRQRRLWPRARLRRSRPDGNDRVARKDGRGLCVRRSGRPRVARGRRCLWASPGQARVGPLPSRPARAAGKPGCRPAPPLPFRSCATPPVCGRGPRLGCLRRRCGGPVRTLAAHPRFSGEAWQVWQGQEAGDALQFEGRQQGSRG